jgi:uncharacterized protein (TIGR03067 family)
MKRACVTLLLLTAGAAWCQDAASDKKALDGRWVPTAAELAGAKFVDEQLKSITLIIEGDKYTVKIGEAVDKGTVKVDAAAKPKALDIMGTDGPNKGKTMLAIYEHQGDTLRVCYDLAGKNRPTEFATSKERPFFLAVYKRAK